MRINNNSDLMGYAVVALIGVVLIYHFWQTLVGALALFGVGYLIREYNRNNRG